MVYKLSEDYVWKEVEDQVVILNLDSGEYYSLNSTGSCIWKGIMNRLTVDEIINQLSTDYDVDHAMLKNDIRDMIAEFCGKNIVTRE